MAANVANTSSISILASAERTADTTSRAFLNQFHRGCQIVVDVSVDGAAASVVFNIQGYDDANDAWFTILQSAAVAAVGTTYYSIYPGITAAANVSASSNLPRVFRVFADHADTDAITYSVAAQLLA